MEFILASASPGRAGVLRAAGVQPLVEVSGVDEEAVTASLGSTDPERIVTTLAGAKADAVTSRVATMHAEAVVVGCDSLLLFGDELVGKPGTAEAARQRWRRIAGQAGQLLTGHAVVRVSEGTPRCSARGAESTVVRFASPTAAELEAYVATGEPLGVAGAFTLDGLGGWFVEGVDGDPSSVVGISLPLTRRLLAEVGVSVVTFWQPA